MGSAYIFPAVRGIQAKREYYISMVPLEIIAEIFQFADDELPPEARSQRILNKARVPEIRDYILSNPDDYVFSALTVSVDGIMDFCPSAESASQIGTLRIPRTARFLINDGQHRKAAITEALKVNEALRKEHISVVFYRDEGLMRSQQMFSDLNRFAIKPTRSINILFNSREESSIIAKRVIEEVPVFHGLVEKERTAISPRQKALFTLSAICTATNELLKNIDLTLDERIHIAINFWTCVGTHMPHWEKVHTGEMKSSDVRRDYICSLSITLVALGYAGNILLNERPDEWETCLARLESIDWSKDNPVWNNLVFINGKVAANRSTQRGMSEYMKDILLETAGNENG